VKELSQATIDYFSFKYLDTSSIPLFDFSEQIHEYSVAAMDI